MIEIYLAFFYLVLGTYFNKKDVFQKTPEGKIAVQPGIDLDEVERVTVPVSTEPPSDTIKRLEEEYGATLDEKCRDIQNRDFSSLLDQKSRELYKMRKMSEKGEKAAADEETHWVY